VPVAWEEIPLMTGADQWTIATASARLSRDDPWADYETSRRSLTDALALLDRTARRGDALSA
jgi:bifunctional non-homologous end joining protein LigD